MTGDLLTGLLQDLDDEGAELDDLVAGLPAGEWASPTPAVGWTIADQVAHLAGTDEMSLRAVTDPGGFRAARDVAGPDATLATAAMPPEHLLAHWRRTRAALASALAALPPGTTLPWFGPDMSVASMVTARLMETWAHGVDVRDTLGRATVATRRLRAIAHLGVRTRDFSFRQRALRPPTEEFLVALTGPDGDVWTWGRPDAGQRVSGQALDFCLLVTRRRHRLDLILDVSGDDADRWLNVAQAFAGPPGPDRPPLAGAGT